MILKYFTLITLIISLLSCKDKSQDNYLQSANDFSVAQVRLIDALNEVERIIPMFMSDDSYTSEASIAVSAQPTLSNPTYPKTITIKYVGNEVVRWDGNTRLGEIKVVIKDEKALKSNFEIVFKDYFINYIQLVGDLNVKVTENTKKYTFNNGLRWVVPNGVIFLSGSFLLEDLTPNNPNIQEKEFQIVGEFSGRDRKGKDFEATISLANELIADFSCLTYLIQGITQITPQLHSSQEINYGNGLCNHLAKVFFDNESFQQISLK